jgi:hypothetical protein
VTSVVPWAYRYIYSRGDPIDPSSPAADKDKEREKEKEHRLIGLIKIGERFGVPPTCGHHVMTTTLQPIRAQFLEPISMSA